MNTTRMLREDYVVLDPDEEHNIRGLTEWKTVSIPPSPTDVFDRREKPSSKVDKAIVEMLEKKEYVTAKGLKINAT